MGISKRKKRRRTKTLINFVKKIHTHLFNLHMQTVPGGKAVANLEAADKFWRNLCDSSSKPPKEVITSVRRGLPADNYALTFDAVFLGGTLGIFLAAALQLKGWRVAVVERNRLIGREQEWNISRNDMQVRIE